MFIFSKVYFNVLGLYVRLASIDYITQDESIFLPDSYCFFIISASIPNPVLLKKSIHLFSLHQYK